MDKDGLTGELLVRGHINLGYAYFFKQTFILTTQVIVHVIF